MVFTTCACSVMSDFLWSYGLWPSRLLCPWDSPGKNTGVGCHFLLWFLPYSDMNQPWVYMCPPSRTHLPPPSPSHPSVSSQCTSPEHPVSCINLEWWTISHMVIYMFQCYSLKSSHPRLLPQSPRVCYLYLCLFCCIAYRAIVSIFLNSIYMH